MFGNGTRVGHYTGTGVAYTLELGFIPDYIKIRNRTDGDVAFEWFYGMPAAYYYNEASGGDNTVATSNGVTVFAGEAPNKVLTMTTQTGTITAAARTLAGTATIFLTELKVGDVVRVIDSSSHHYQQDFTVASIESATSLTTVEAAEQTHTVSDFIRLTPRKPGLTLGSSLSESGKVLDYMTLRGDHDNT